MWGGGGGGGVGAAQNQLLKQAKLMEFVILGHF